MLKKGLKPDITEEHLEAIAKQTQVGKRAGKKNYLKDITINDEDYADETLRLIIGNIGNKNDETSLASEENTQTPLLPENTSQSAIDAVKAAIHTFRGNEFNDKEIESAMLFVTRKNPSANIMETMSATHAELCKRKEERENKEKRKQQEKENLVNLEEMLKDLPVSKIKGINKETPHA